MFTFANWINISANTTRNYLKINDNSKQLVLNPSIALDLKLFTRATCVVDLNERTAI
jgi:hypothetical protein